MEDGIHRVHGHCIEKSYARVLMPRDAFNRSFLSGDWVHETKAKRVLRCTLLN